MKFVPESKLEHEKTYDLEASNSTEFYKIEVSSFKSERISKSGLKTKLDRKKQKFVRGEKKGVIILVSRPGWVRSEDDIEALANVSRGVMRFSRRVGAVILITPRFGQLADQFDPLAIPSLGYEIATIPPEANLDYFENTIIAENNIMGQTEEGDLILKVPKPDIQANLFDRWVDEVVKKSAPYVKTT